MNLISLEFKRVIKSKIFLGVLLFNIIFYFYVNYNMNNIYFISYRNFQNCNINLYTFCPSCQNIRTWPEIYVKTRLSLFILVLTSILGRVNWYLQEGFYTLSHNTRRVYLIHLFIEDFFRSFVSKNFSRLSIY